MDKHYQKIGKQVGLVGAIWGSLVIALPAMGLPPISVSQQPPLPSQQEPPSGTVVPVNQKVSINLMNQTGAPVTYQVLGNTKPRTLKIQSQVMLRDLPTPITLTFNHEHKGGALITVSTQPASKPGVLEVKLMPTNNWRNSYRSLRIQKRGDIFLN